MVECRSRTDKKWRLTTLKFPCGWWRKSKTARTIIELMLVTIVHSRPLLLGTNVFIDPPKCVEITFSVLYYVCHYQCLTVNCNLRCPCILLTDCQVN